MRLRWIFIFLLSCLPSFAGTVNPTYRFADYVSNPESVRRVTLTPFKGPIDTSNSTNFTAEPIIRLTDTNGSVTFSNVVNNYSYTCRLEGPQVNTTVTNYFKDTDNGNLDSGTTKQRQGVWVGTAFAYFTFNSSVPINTMDSVVTTDANNTATITNTIANSHKIIVSSDRAHILTINARDAGSAGDHMWLLIDNQSSYETFALGQYFLTDTEQTAFSAMANSTVEFISDGTGWIEVSRHVP